MSLPEGNDIFFEDFIRQEQQLIEEEHSLSEIQKFYEGTTIFITGATGFFGKILLEKLLRSCRKLKRIYILMRPKKNKSIQDRFVEQFDDVIYENLKRKQPNCLRKIVIVQGDLSQTEILSKEDRETLIKEVDIVFHCAATVRFDEKLKQAVQLNVEASKYFLELGREMKNLKSYIHVSTAYVNCNKNFLPEAFVPPKYTYDQIKQLLNILDEETIEKVTPQLIENWPNTYTFTKSIAENTVRDLGKGLPLGVYRPSIVVSTYKEPIAGWINNYYGPQGIVFGAAVGLLRTLYCDGELNSNMVPVDMVINGLLAFAWDVGQTKGDNPNFEKIYWKDESKDENENEKAESSDDVPIMVYGSSNRNPIKWKEFMNLTYETGHDSYTVLMLWHSSLTLNKNYYWDFIYQIFLHFLPAAIIDGICKLQGKEARLWKAYTKIRKLTKIVQYFCITEMIFEEKYSMKLWDKMSNRDKEIFNFDISEMDWRSYTSSYLKGFRVYLAKDDLSTLPQARKKAYRLKVLHYTLITVFTIIWIWLAWCLLSWVLL